MLDSSDEHNCQIILNVTSHLFSLKIRIGPGPGRFLWKRKDEHH